MAKNFVSNKDETAVIFKNPVLEKLSRVHWSVPLFLFVPVVLYFLYKAVVVLHIAALSITGLFIAGVIAWTFTEYTLHRFVFHAHFPGKAGERISFLMHGVHHDYPNDTKRLVMVPAVSVPLAVLFYFVFYYVLGAYYYAPAFSGFITGYLIYDMSHYAIHHYNTKSPYWKSLKKYHALHHYSESEKYYGVSARLWDHVFGTLPKESEETIEGKEFQG
ncbi:MAG: sterol desaturase family protein [Bacteroidia bacterium]